MEIRFDWPKIYNSVLFPGAASTKASFVAARGIRSEIEQGDLRPGTILGKRSDLCARYGLGRETLLEAVRLLEDWEVARMHRGASGGLVVLPFRPWDAERALSEYLRACGVTADQLTEAGKVLAIITTACAEEAAGRAREFDARFRQWIDRGESPLTMPSARLSPNRVLDPFSCVLDRLSARTPGEKLLEKKAPEPRANAPRPLTVFVTEHLLQEVSRCRALGETHVGFEAELMEKIGVSRQIMRQGLRLLEDKGLVVCNRGRGRGVATSTAHPPALLERLIQHYERGQIGMRECRPVQKMLGRLNRLLVAVRLDDRKYRALVEVEESSDGSDPTLQMRRSHLEWRMLDNPVLSLLEQFLAAYRSHRAGPGVFVGEINLENIHRGLLRSLEAGRELKLAEADRLHQEVHAEINTSLAAC